MWQPLVKVIRTPEVRIHRKGTHTNNKNTIKTSMPKQPKNLTAKEILEMVTGEEVKIPILIGDINARFGNENNIRKTVIAKQLLHAEENDNGKLLLDFCFLNKCFFVGILFIHKDMRNGA